MEYRSTYLKKASQAYFYRSQEAGVLALMVNEDLVALLVVDVFRLIEIGMGVAAEDNVNARGVGNEIDVHIGRLSPTEMAKADDNVAMLLLTQMVDDGLRSLCWTCVAHTFVVISRHKSFGLRTNAKDAYTHARAFYYYIWFDKSMTRCAREVVVAADKRKLCHLNQSGKVLETEVELVIADGAGVIVHEVHQLDFHIALKEVIVNRTLAEVTTIEQQEVVGMFFAHLLEQSRPSHIASLVCLSRIAEIRGNRFHAGMCVARVDEEDLALWRPTNPL